MAEALAGGLKKQSEADSPVEFNFHGGVFYPKGKNPSRLAPATLKRSLALISARLRGLCQRA
ncbi:MAG: hypothetical protein ACLT5I_06855 [[Clostridium] leptum]